MMPPTPRPPRPRLWRWLALGVLGLAVAVAVVVRARTIPVDLLGLVPADALGYLQLSVPGFGQPGPSLSALAVLPWARALSGDSGLADAAAELAWRQLAVVWLAPGAPPLLLAQARAWSAPRRGGEWRQVGARVYARGEGRVIGGGVLSLRGRLGERGKGSRTVVGYLATTTPLVASLDTQVVQPWLESLAALRSGGWLATADWRPGFWRLALAPVGAAAVAPATTGVPSAGRASAPLLSPHADLPVLIHGVSVGVLTPWLAQQSRSAYDLADLLASRLALLADGVSVDLALGATGGGAQATTAPPFAIAWRTPSRSETVRRELELLAAALRRQLQPLRLPDGTAVVEEIADNLGLQWLTTQDRGVVMVAAASSTVAIAVDGTAVRLASDVDVLTKAGATWPASSVGRVLACADADAPWLLLRTPVPRDWDLGSWLPSAPAGWLLLTADAAGGLVGCWQ